MKDGQKTNAKVLPGTSKERQRTRPRSQSSWVPVEGDKIPSETLTVQYGYVPLKDQIERMIRAGKELDAFRKEYYDFGDEREIPAGFDDPTRKPGFDPVDAYQYMRQLARKVKAREKQIAAQATAAQEAIAKDSAKPKEEQANKPEK